MGKKKNSYVSKYLFFIFLENNIFALLFVFRILNISFIRATHYHTLNHICINHHDAQFIPFSLPKSRPWQGCQNKFSAHSWNSEQPGWCHQKKRSSKKIMNTREVKQELGFLVVTWMQQLIEIFERQYLF